MLTTSFVLKLRKLCDTYQALIVADEVLTGLGRTGRFFSYEHYGVDFLPDYVMVGKGLLTAALCLVMRPMKNDTTCETDSSTTTPNSAVEKDDEVNDDDASDDRDDAVDEDEDDDEKIVDRKRKQRADDNDDDDDDTDDYTSPYQVDALIQAHPEFREHITYEPNARHWLEAAALLERIASGDLIQNARRTGEHMMMRLREIESRKMVPPPSDILEPPKNKKAKVSVTPIDNTLSIISEVMCVLL